MFYLPADVAQQLVKELTTSLKLQSNYQEKYCEDRWKESLPDHYNLLTVYALSQL